METCQICGKKSLDTFEQPIDYLACYNCHTVYVKGKDGTISMLNIHVEYNPDYSNFFYRLLNKIKIKQ